MKIKKAFIYGLYTIILAIAFTSCKGPMDPQNEQGEYVQQEREQLVIIPPLKTFYFIGESFNTEGMAIRVSYGNFFKQLHNARV